MLQLLVEAGASLRVMDREDRSPLYLGEQYLATSAAKRSIGSTTGFHNHGEGPYWVPDAIIMRKGRL